MIVICNEIKYNQIEYISVLNGVIILDGKDENYHGGDLKVMPDDFADNL